MDEREGKTAKLGFFGFVRVKRVLKEKVVTVENVMLKMLCILESGSGEERRREGCIFFFFLSFKNLLSCFCWMDFLSIVVRRCYQVENVE